MLVKNLLEQKEKKDLITVKPSTSLDEAIGLLVTNRIGSVLVLNDKGDLKGIVTDYDILKHIHTTKGDYHKLTVDDIMTTTLIVGLPGDDIDNIAAMMNKNWIRHVPIVENDKLVGLVSLRDINRLKVKNIEIDNRFLQQHLDGMHMRDMSGE